MPCADGGPFGVENEIKFFIFGEIFGETAAERRKLNSNRFFFGRRSFSANSADQFRRAPNHPTKEPTKWQKRRKTMKNCEINITFAIIILSTWKKTPTLYLIATVSTENSKKPRGKPPNHKTNQTTKKREKNDEYMYILPATVLRWNPPSAPEFAKISATKNKKNGADFHSIFGVRRSFSVFGGVRLGFVKISP